MELSERLAIKYMCMSENKYGQLIESHLIVANSQLKIEKTAEYLVSDVHSTRGYFAYADEISNMSATTNTDLNPVNFNSHLQSQNNLDKNESEEGEDDMFERLKVDNLESLDASHPEVLFEQKISPSDT